MKLIDAEPIIEKVKAAIEVGQNYNLPTDELEQMLMILEETPEYGKRSGTLFLTLNDAVTVAAREFGCDRKLARQEFEQKCFVPSSDYEIGRFKGLEEAEEAIKNVIYGALQEKLSRGTSQMKEPEDF